MTLTQRERRCLFAGYRIARAQAKREREEMAAMFVETLNEIHDELSGVRSEITRIHAIERAIECEREPWQRIALTLGAVL
jgi:outer membrane protein TolC